MPKNTEVEEEELDRGDDFIPDDEELDEDEDDEVEEDEEDYEDEEDDEDGSEEDEDEEDESDEDDEDDEEEEEDDEGDEEEARIPRSRLNQVIEQRENERARAEWLEEQLELMIEAQTKQQPAQQPAAPAKPKEPEYDFEAKEIEYADLIIEGDTKAASRLRAEINAARDKEVLKQLESVREKATEEALTKAESSRDEEKFESVIAKTQETYKFLDDSDDSYSQEAVEAINAQMQGYIVSGDRKSVALAKAVKNLAPLYAKALGAEEEPQKEALGKKRTKAARKKAAKTSRQQPPATKRAVKGKAKRDLDALDLAKMSEKEYNKLSLRERKALRGD